MSGSRGPPDVGDMIAASEKNSVENPGYGSGSEKAKEEDIEMYSPAEEKEMDEAPNGGKGWIMIACVATINAYVIPSSYLFCTQYKETDF